MDHHVIWLLSAHHKFRVCRKLFPSSLGVLRLHPSLRNVSLWRRNIGEKRATRNVRGQQSNRREKADQNFCKENIALKYCFF